MQQELFAVQEFPLENAVDEASLGTLDDVSILQKIREDVLQGAYYLIDYRGYAGYEPGDNVVHIISMGSTDHRSHTRHTLKLC